MTGEEKLASVEQQIFDCMRGVKASPHFKPMITCPYCGVQNLPEGDQACCVLFARAAAAVLHRLAVREQLEYAEQIAEQVARN